ncbi:hypothetical protein ElyMa_004803500 [Elysia marginata]|uniref:Uncharacterized protein n=1 Tax=Elysia marginata TaxID=1093978 RepID=A0AAV4IKT2_9GAST|nr:hypothetical protein ElyMa_004803500 [Elysia marginata]
MRGERANPRHQQTAAHFRDQRQHLAPKNIYSLSTKPRLADHVAIKHERSENFVQESSEKKLEKGHMFLINPYFFITETDNTSTVSDLLRCKGSASVVGTLHLQNTSDPKTATSIKD